MPSPLGLLLYMSKGNALTQWLYAYASLPVSVIPVLSHAIGFIGANRDIHSIMISSIADFKCVRMVPVADASVS